MKILLAFFLVIVHCGTSMPVMSKIDQNEEKDIPESRIGGSQELASPEGAYRKSCGGCKVSDQNILSCLCSRNDYGKWALASLDLDNCTNSIVNDAGTLSCHGLPYSILKHYLSTLAGLPVALGILYFARLFAAAPLPILPVPMNAPTKAH